jgi:hypothetical protein
LARLFHSFDWSPPEGLKAEDIDTTEVYGMTMPKSKPLIAVAKPRLSHDMYSPLTSLHFCRLIFVRVERL